MTAPRLARTALGTLGALGLLGALHTTARAENEPASTMRTKVSALARKSMALAWHC